MRTIRRASKTELDLNDAQITACKRHAGAARWAYNGGLRRKQETYAAPGKSASALEVHRELNTLKKTAVPWLYAVAKCAPQEALRNRDRAFDGFFRRGKRTQRGKHRGKHRGKVGYPRCKSKKRGPGSFRRTGAIVMFPTAIRLPRLGCLRLKERGYLPTAGVKATVSEPAGHG